MSKQSSSLRVPVLIDRESYDMFKAYSELTGVPVSVLVRRAMADYASVTIGARMDTLTAATAPCTHTEDVDFVTFPVQA